MMGHPDPQSEHGIIDWVDNDAIERIVEQRIAQRFEAESFQWRFRLVVIETVIMGLLVLVAGLVLKQNPMLVLRAALMISASCLATGVLLLSLSAGTLRMMARLGLRKRS